MSEEKKCVSDQVFRPWQAMSPAASSPSTSRSSSPRRQAYDIESLLRKSPTPRSWQVSSSDSESQRSDSVGSAEDNSRVQVPQTSYQAPILPLTCYGPTYPVAYYPSALPLEYPTLPFDYQQAVQRLRQQEAEAKQARRSRPKKFGCPECTATFSNKGQLRGHYRIHTGERPFKCTFEDCNKDFTRNEELTRHKRIHEGIRPYPCGFCGKPFGRKDHLKKHTKTHERALAAEAQRNYAAAAYHMAQLGEAAAVGYPQFHRNF